MKTLIFSSIALIFSFIAETQNYDWVKNWGGTSFDIANNMHVDENGNSYLTGWLKDTVNIDGTNYVSSGNQDLLVVKVNSAGSVEWVFTGGGNDNDQGYGIDVDGSGNVYVGGSFQGPASFGGSSLSGFGAFDILIVKLNSDGVFQWAKEFGSTLDDQANGLCVSPSGIIYIGGNCNNGIAFGSTTLTTNSYDAFVAKLDAGGNPIWALNGGSANVDNLYGMDIDDSENIYFTGYIGGSPANFGTFNLSNNGDDDIYVAAVDSSGTVLWALSHGGADQEQGQGVKVDNYGDVLVTGYFTSSSITIGSNTFNVSGINTLFLGKYDPVNGSVINSFSFPSDAGSSGQEISVDGNDNIYIAGSFRGTFISGDDTVVSAGNSDGLLLALDDQYQPLCLTSINSSGFWDIIYGVGTDQQNNVYFSGTYNDAANIDVYNLNSNGAADIFIAKMICDTSVSTSIKDHTTDFTISVFPNPAEKVINIAFPFSKNDLDVSLVDLNGKVLQRKENLDLRSKTNTQLDISGLSNGYYLIVIKDHSAMYIEKLLVID